MKINSDKNQTNLPWWVELLFVQVGLPDSLLRNWLNAKVKLNEHINNQKNITIIKDEAVDISVHNSKLNGKY